MAPTTAPRGLGKAGRALWRSISDPEHAWKLNPAERAVLHRACRVADRCAELDAQYDALIEVGTVTDDDGNETSALLSKGSMGQEVEHPVLVALAKHDALLQRLITSLKLPDLDMEQASSTSASARKAAQARWAKPRTA